MPAEIAILNEAIRNLRSRGYDAWKGPPCYGKQSIRIASGTEQIGKITALLDFVVIAEEDGRWFVLDESSPKNRIVFDASTLAEAVEAAVARVLEKKQKREAKAATNTHERNARPLA